MVQNYPSALERIHGAFVVHETLEEREVSLVKVARESYVREVSVVHRPAVNEGTQASAVSDRRGEGIVVLEMV